MPYVHIFHSKIPFYYLGYEWLNGDPNNLMLVYKYIPISITEN